MSLKFNLYDLQIFNFQYRKKWHINIFILKYTITKIKINFEFDQIYVLILQIKTRLNEFLDV